MSNPANSLPIPPAEGPARVLWGLRHGVSRRCPRCGVGRLYRRYLGLSAACERCALEVDRFRSDDVPAYFTILLVGHLIVPLVLLVERGWAPSVWLHAAIWIPATLALTLAILPFIKGAVIGVQWALGVGSDGR